MAGRQVARNTKWREETYVSRWIHVEKVVHHVKELEEPFDDDDGGRHANPPNQCYNYNKYLWYYSMCV